MAFVGLGNGFPLDNGARLGFIGAVTGSVIGLQVGGVGLSALFGLVGAGAGGAVGGYLDNRKTRGSTRSVGKQGRNGAANQEHESASPRVQREQVKPSGELSDSNRVTRRSMVLVGICVALLAFGLILAPRDPDLLRQVANADREPPASADLSARPNSPSELVAASPRQSAAGPLVPAVDADAVSAGVAKYVELLDRVGANGVIEYSRSCYQALGSSPRYSDIDYCFSIDVAASDLDSAIMVYSENKPKPYLIMLNVLERVRGAVAPLPGTEADKEDHFLTAAARVRAEHLAVKNIK